MNTFRDDAQLRVEEARRLRRLQLGQIALCEQAALAAAANRCPRPSENNPDVIRTQQQFDVRYASRSIPQLNPSASRFVVPPQNRRFPQCVRSSAFQ